MALSNPARCVTIATMGALVIALTGAAFAGDAPTGPLKRAPVPSLIASAKEMREKMATLHEEMAACLRSDKSMSECRSEMLKRCEAIMGSEDCRRMMGTGCGMKGMSFHHEHH